MGNLLNISDLKMKSTKEKIFVIIAFFGAMFHIWNVTISSMSMWPYRVIHVALAVVLVTMLKPMRLKNTSLICKTIDAGIIALSIAVAAYIVLEYERIAMYIDFAPKTADIVFCGIGILFLLEATRRANGIAMPILCMIFMLYARYGNIFTGLFGHRGYTWKRIFTFNYGINGVFGTSVGVSSTYVILFVIFGAVLEGTGGGRLVIEAAINAFGKYRGGPAKAAIFASAGMGTISGTAAGNVVTTGTFTIPLMKKTGYSDTFAGAVEAVASTGGQIMPPIMGAGAFIMAETLGVNYSVVARGAVIPAVLYFLSVFIMVDCEAHKLGLTGMKKEELPVMKTVMNEVGHMGIPIFVLLFFLIFTNFSPLKAAMYTTLFSLIIAMLKKSTRYNLGQFILMFANGMKDAAGVILACACAGIVVGVLSLTGLGTKLAAIIVSLAGGNLLLTLVLTMAVTMIMGMGLPTTASYIIASTVIAPALIKMDVAPLAAHFFVFYYACLSAITPPVAIAAYAAAGISGASADKTGWKAFQLGLAAFIVPYMFVYSNSLLMVGDVSLIVRSAITAIIGTIVFGYGVSGWFMHRANLFVSAVLIAAALLLIDSRLITDVMGLGLIAAAYLLQTFAFKKVNIENAQ